MRDGLSNIQVVKGAQQTLSGTTANNSALFDLRGFGSAAFDLHTGVVTDAGAADGFSMKLQHSDTTAAADFVDVPAGEFQGAVAVTDDAADNVIAGSMGYVGNKRYVRAVLTGTTNTAAVVFVVGNLGKPSVAPVTRVGATVAAT
jgi:acetyl-CoA carboxylase beta subunit